MARRNLKHKYLLQGLVSCGHCRLCCFVRARGRAVAPGERQYHYYLCRGKQAAVTSRHEQLCPSRFIPAAELDALVWADLCTVLQTPEILAEALQRARTGAWLPETVQQQHASIRTAHQSLERQQERLLDAYVAGLLDLAAFEKRQRGLADRMAELAARERELLAQGQRLLDTAKILASMTEVCARLRQNLEAATFEQRRAVVELLIDRVVVTDDEVEIRYVVPTTESSLHTRFGQLRQDYLHHPPPQHHHEALRVGGAAAAGRLTTSTRQPSSVAAHSGQAGVPVQAVRPDHLQPRAGPWRPGTGPRPRPSPGCRRAGRRRGPASPRYPSTRAACGP